MCSLGHCWPCNASASLQEQKMSPADDADIAENTADDLIRQESYLRTSAKSAGNKSQVPLRPLRRLRVLRGSGKCLPQMTQISQITPQMISSDRNCICAHLRNLRETKSQVRLPPLRRLRVLRGSGKCLPQMTRISQKTSQMISSDRDRICEHLRDLREIISQIPLRPLRRLRVLRGSGKCLPQMTQISQKTPQMISSDRDRNCVHLRDLRETNHRFLGVLCAASAFSVVPFL